MTKIGIVEGFFGSPWSKEARLDWGPFLKKYGGDFYFYAPKRDAHLRKEWRAEWSSGFLHELQELRDHFHKFDLSFGVGFSPFGLGSPLTLEDRSLLKKKFKSLSGLGIDTLGLFFDDMPSSDNLLSIQAEVVELALQYFPKGLIFCPSYYSYDPILDKVFGARPVGYVEGLKAAIPSQVDICWTGPKVISEEISNAHLLEVSALLERKPFIWENVFANDGPRNCKFLKLKYFQGRDSSLIHETNGIGFNLMNEAYLSQILYLSSLWVMQKGLSPEAAFEQSCFELHTRSFAEFLIRHRVLFLDIGLDKISEGEKASLMQELSGEFSDAAKEVVDWLKGDYIVGPECLTD